MIGQEKQIITVRGFCSFILNLGQNKFLHLSFKKNALKTGGCVPVQYYDWSIFKGLGCEKNLFTVETLVKGTLWLLLLFDALKNSIIRICGVTTDSTYTYTFFSSLQIGPY
jgi:hypothetical protein